MSAQVFVFQNVALMCYACPHATIRAMTAPIHVVAAVARECAWIKEYRLREEEQSDLVRVTECREPEKMTEALAEECSVLLVDAHGYGKGAVGNRWDLSLVNPQAKFGATSAVILGACYVLEDPEVRASITGACANRVLTGGTEVVQARDSRKLLIELCRSGADLTKRDQVLAALIAAAERLTARMPKWPTRWSTPELIRGSV